jgi:hypothetical protein
MLGGSTHGDTEMDREDYLQMVALLQDLLAHRLEKAIEAYREKANAPRS